MIILVQGDKVKCLFKHRWEKVKTIGTTVYYECSKCGARKAVYTLEFSHNLRWTWLVGITQTLNQSPNGKDKDNG